MKSVKPGRGPSMMGGVAGIAVCIFGIIWTIGALSIGGGPFALFGLVFIAMSIAITVYNFKNATSKNRYSVYDITDDGEEPDPLNQRFGAQNQSDRPDASAASFCPYCGAKAQSGYSYCSSCGKKLP